ncbi:MAG TPA: diguanylate cyclase [Spirochaetota bacterium]|nr:diguanylate cyclase [Spirochaetota bacterium]
MTKLINLLIADDDRFIRRSIIRMLDREEIFRIYEAESRDSVLDALKESKIDCVLMDYYMSDITGVELMHIFKQNGISVPVIMLTGQGDEQLAVNIIKAGAFDYIPKSRLAEQDFAMTLTTMVSNAVSRQEEIEQADRSKIALELSEARYRGLIENSPILIVRFFPEENMISFANDFFCSYFGVQRFSILGENILHIIPQSNHALFESKVRGITHDYPVARIELNTLSNGEHKWQLWTVQGIFDSDGETSEYQCMGEDITDMKNTEKQLIEQKRYLQSILDSQDNMFIVADRTKVLEVNISFLQFFGFYSPDDMEKNFGRIAEMTVEMDGYLKPEDANSFWLANISAATGAGQYRLIAFRQEGSETNRYFSVKFSPLSIDTDIYVVEFSDVTALEERSKEFENRANYDPLTKIYNRRRFLELLERGMKTALHLNLDLSIVFFDIDHFKKINDNYGHNTGDEVLKGLSLLVSAAIRHSDIFARWGGEEFLVLLESTSLENAARAAEKIRKAIMEHEFPDVKKVTCSFGVTSFHPRDTGEAFINRADAALYRAKESGRNRVIGMRKKLSEEAEKVIE